MPRSSEEAVVGSGSRLLGMEETTPSGWQHLADGSGTRRDGGGSAWRLEEMAPGGRIRPPLGWGTWIRRPTVGGQRRWPLAVGDGGRGTAAHLLLASARRRALLTAASSRRTSSTPPCHCYFKKNRIEK
ncbi:hypothetical protein [Oryza sativa Japonica Group]|uniref:Uncharacterized protein n=1 Tax=Oryza sativa subsp. japonica TaxID=39947 RepID=Q5QMR0_ORYSJ|nr:hypothetical protein [Oryza sativa Japonica Group]BAD73360.1 hypothetical protein [Oryza sativa Japonica Group]